MKVPVAIKKLQYFDEFNINYKFADAPRYVPDSLEFFFLGDIFHRTGSFCSIPYDPKQNFQFIYNKTFNDSLSFIITDRLLQCAM